MRTSRDTAARRAAAEAMIAAGDTVDAVPSPDFVQETPANAVAAQGVAASPKKIDRAEVRRRIEFGAAGTYITDMLADRDSTLTRWPDRTMEPLRVWVQRVSDAKDWNPDYTVAARGAFDEWADAGAPIRFTFIVDSTRADIRVNFVERLQGGNRLGVTTHAHDGGGWIMSATIDIALQDSAGKAIPSPVVAATARHEVGHALGLAHSRDRASIMFPESQTLAISGPDRATLKLLYTLPPGSIK